MVKLQNPLTCKRSISKPDLSFFRTMKNHLGVQFRHPSRNKPLACSFAFLLANLQVTTNNTLRSYYKANIHKIIYNNYNKMRNGVFCFTSSVRFFQTIFLSSLKEYFFLSEIFSSIQVTPMMMILNVMTTHHLFDDA